MIDSRAVISPRAQIAADVEIGPFTVIGADVVIGGHTHAAADRVIGGIRALNPGSTGLPRTCGMAGWLLIDADGDAMTVTYRSVPFDAAAVVADLRGRNHPNAEFVASVLTGQRQMLLVPSGDAAASSWIWPGIA